MRGAAHGQYSGGTVIGWRRMRGIDRQEPGIPAGYKILRINMLIDLT
jgi:hypothetical protein